MTIADASRSPPRDASSSRSARRRSPRPPAASTRSRPARRRPRRGARPRHAGHPGLIGRDRDRHPPLGLEPPAASSPTQQAAAAVGQNVLIYRYQDARPVRHRRRPGAADRRRRDPTQPLPQRAAHHRAAARAAHPADRQRERHRRHPRDPVRRQRPARGAGRPPRRTPTCSSCSRDVDGLYDAPPGRPTGAA